MILTAEQAKALRGAHPEDIRMAQHFNDQLASAITSNRENKTVNLHFSQFGDDWGSPFIELLQQHGYTVDRIGACGWWEVTW